MYHFYTDRKNIGEESVILDGPEANHIRNALRMKDGEELIVCDGGGTDHFCRICGGDGRRLVLEILKSAPSEAELSTRIVLFQGLPKKDKMELIIQKAVELGVCEIVPVMTKRVIVKLDDPAKERKKLERWQQISKSAAEQSGRGMIPEVSQVIDFGEALIRAKKLESLVIPYENADNSCRGLEASRKVVQSLKGSRSIGIMIGPEGGFEEEEVKLAVEAGFRMISLGKRILRTETAGPAALAIIGFELD